MSIQFLALFGSCARGDQEDSSDIDVLAVAREGKFKAVSLNKLNISIYPESYMIDNASRGDLFVLHIVREAKPIYDESGIFSKLKSTFRYKDTYEQEIKLASDLGWFITTWKERFKDQRLFNKRMAWCLRTILIAKSTEEGEPTFSAAKLAMLAESDSVLKVIEQKDRKTIDREVVRQFEVLLQKFGRPIPRELKGATIQSAHNYFMRENNSIATKTAEAVLRSINAESYL